MKKIVRLTALVAAGVFAAAGFFVSCADADSSAKQEFFSNALKNGSVSTASASSIKFKTTSGTIGAKAATVGLIKSITLTDSTGGAYTLTENTSASPFMAGRSSAVVYTKNWNYNKNGVTEKQGYYTGDIGKIGEEDTKIVMTVTKTVNSINEPVKVVEEKSFDLNCTKTSFTAELPLVPSGVLDLRIKGGIAAYSTPDSVYSGNAVSMGNPVTGKDPVKTAHATATVYENGIYFEITKPTDACYKNGLGYVGIWKMEEIDSKTVQTTRVEAQYIDGGTRSKKCAFWALCTPNTKMTFKVQIEPIDVNNNRQYMYYETLTITSEGGIGDIDYSNLNAKKWLTCEYPTGSFAKFDASSFKAPENLSWIRTDIGVFAGNGDWVTNNATIYAGCFYRDGVNFNVNLTDDEKTSLTKMVKQNGKNTFFYQYQFTFYIPVSNGSTTTYYIYQTHNWQSDILTLSK